MKQQISILFTEERGWATGQVGWRTGGGVWGSLPAYCHIWMKCNLGVNRGEMLFQSWFVCILATGTKIHERKTLDLLSVRWRWGENWLLSSEVVMPSWVEMGSLTSYFLQVRPGTSWLEVWPAIQALDLFLTVWDLLGFRAKGGQTEQWYKSPWALCTK